MAYAPPLDTIRLAEELANRKKQTAANAAAAGQSNINLPELHQRFGNTMPYMNDPSPLGRFKDMAMRQQSRLGSAFAAVQAVKERQAREQEANAAKLQEHEARMKYGGEKTIETPYGKVTANYSPTASNPKMYIGPKGGTPLEGEALQEVFQRAANAGSPNAGVGLLPGVEPGYGRSILSERGKILEAMKAVKARQMANAGSSSGVVPSVSAGKPAFTDSGASASISAGNPTSPEVGVGIESPTFGKGARKPEVKSTAGKLSPKRESELRAKAFAALLMHRARESGVNASNAINQINPLNVAYGLKNWWETPR